MSGEVDKSKSLEDQVAAFMSSKKVRHKIQLDSRDLNSPAGKFRRAEAFKYARKLKVALSREVSSILSKETGRAYLNYIRVDTEIKKRFHKGESLFVVGLNFSKKYMHRNSLIPDRYPEGVNIAYIMHEGYAYSQKKAPKGKDRHGNRVLAWHKRKPNRFAERAIKKFNKSTPDHVEAVSEVFQKNK